MILKFEKYSNSDVEKGGKFRVFDNVVCYDVVNINVPNFNVDNGIVCNESETEEIENIREYIFNFIYDSKNKQDRIDLVRFRIRVKNKTVDETVTVYTDNVVYICNDEGQTVEKFRKK